MNREHAEEFTRTLGQILGASWRQIKLAHRMGVPKALGISTQQWVTESLGGYLKLSPGEQEEAVGELTAEGYSQRQIEAITGINDTRVHRIQSASNEADDAPAAVDYAVSEGAGASNEAPSEPEQARKHNYRAQGTGQIEWYTPPEWIEPARAVLGGIDLDPASSEVAQRTVKAKRFFTIDDDGLRQEWHGPRIWLNPPYSRDLIPEFVSKLVTEHDAGRVEAAIMLTHNYTDTAWFQKAGSRASAICFPRGRMKFLDPDGNRSGTPTQGQALFYFGNNVESFIKHFAPLGLVKK
jgi:phage N-6-adenine-methyltransferase